MELGRKQLGHSHHRDHDSGGMIVRPRLYELVAEVSFLGLRPRVFDHLVDVEHLAAAVGLHIDESGDQRPLLRYTITDKSR